MRGAWRSARNWAALALLIVAWFAQRNLETAIYRPLARSATLHMIVGGQMMLAPFALLTLTRLASNLALFVAISLIIGRRAFSFPLPDRRAGLHVGQGAAIGFAVMVTAILAIVLTGAAQVHPSPQGAGSAFAHGLGWFVFNLIGATGEELYGRGAVLIVAASFLGWRGALLASGATFLVLHLGNPGASPVWLVRLFLQGVLLAYAVYCTGSLWWSVGYHTGWNWASAPLFGAAGSGYLNEGHLLDFTPTGSAWITGAAIGPEGSVFAFLAVGAAFLLLLATKKLRRSPVAV